jgi:hypothetical protein
MVLVLPDSQCWKHHRLHMASTDQTGNPKPERELTPQARRALAEAEERRRLADARKAASPQPPKEIGGQDGPDPTRYGDWEKNGIASDF